MYNSKSKPHKDYVHIMSYDLHGSWENKVGHHSQFRPHKNDAVGDEASTNYAVNYWIGGGLPAEKLVYGMPAYGRCFKGSANTKILQILLLN